MRQYPLRTALPRQSSNLSADSQLNKAKKNKMGKFCRSCCDNVSKCFSSIDLNNKNFRMFFFLILFVVLLFTWITLLTLLILTFLKEDFLLNKTYSAKTIHLHKVTVNAQIPIQWNSLGAVTPYVEPQLGSRKWAPTTYFPFVNDKEQYSNKELENPYDYTMYINSERTLTILSSICPFIYLLTLVVVCSISLAYFFAEVADAYSFTIPQLGLSFLMSLTPAKVRYFWCIVTILVYAVGLFVVFATGALVQKTNWKEIDVEYMISNQIPSVLYNIFVLAMYCLYLKRKEPYWKIIVEKYKNTYTSSEEDERELLQKPEPFFANPEQPVLPNPGLKFAVPQMQSMYNTQVAWQMPIQVPKQQELLMDSSAFVYRHHAKNPLLNDKGEQIPDSPVSNEFNVVVCIILLLGGIANLGLVKAYFLETEAQLVIICLVMFCVLEIGRNHIFSYFWFASKADGGYERFAIVFIDFVVFLLQLFIVFIWQYTMTDLIYVNPDSIVNNTRGILLFVLTCFLITRLISVVQGIMEIIGHRFGCSSCVCEPDDASEDNSMMLVWTELVMYLLVMLVFIMFVFAQSLPLPKVENLEKKLIFQEQMIYQNTEQPTVADSSCNLGIQKNSLISTTNKLCSLDSEDVYELSPVTMKVFAWTRFYILQDEIPTREASPSANVLFCSNGFEQHWGQCKTLFSTQGGQFWDAWDTRVKQATGIPV